GAAGGVEGRRDTVIICATYHLGGPTMGNETDRQAKGVSAILRGAQDSLTAKRVFGDPIEKDGVLMYPAASIRGGGGGGEGGVGGSPNDEVGEGLGGGFGISARPVGMYVVKDGNVKWKPAIDVTRIVTGINVVAVVYFLVTWRIATARARRIGIA
ncbi:MAG: hypothetical protein U9N84_10305, partial [Actinomycetota bacterium]|nr:hypothetical protein [Actinomycetota bacterium]